MTNFNIQVALHTGAARAKLVKFSNDLNRVETAGSRMGATLGRAFGAVAIIAGATAATRALAGFSQEMSTVSAVTQATEKDFARLQERAIQLGTNTRFTATQAAEGMTFLARAGFDADEVLGSIGDTLNLAQAGALDLGRAADITSNVLKGMRLEVDQTARVVDVLALAANSSNTNVTQLGDAMKLVAPIAAGVGVSVEDTAAAIGVLSDAGLQATLAGTGLRRVISTLEQGGPKLEKALKGTGITLDDVRVSSVGLTTAIENIGKAGISTAKGLDIFGQRGGPAFEVLRTAGPAVAEFADELRNAGGTAARVAKTMDDNLNGSILATKSAIEGLVLRIGESGATGALRSFFDTLTTGFRYAAANAEEFSAILKGLAFVIGVTLARQALGSLIQASVAFAASMALNPVYAMGTAIIVLAGLFVAFKDQVSIATDTTTTFGDLASATFSEIAKIFETLVSAASSALSGLDGPLDGFGLSVENVFLLTASLIDGAFAAFLALGNSLVALFGGIGPAIGEGFYSIILGLNGLINSGVNFAIAGALAIKDTFVSVGISVMSFFREMDNAATALAQGQAGLAYDIASGAVDVLKGQLGNIGNTIDQTFTANLKKLEAADALNELANPFAGAGMNLAQAMTDGFNEGLDFSGATDLALRALSEADASRLAKEQAAAEKARAAAEGGPAGSTGTGGEGAGGAGAAPSGTSSAVEKSLALQAELLERIQGPHKEYLATQEALGQLFESDTISAEEYAIALNDAAIAANTLGTSASQGLGAGIAQIKNQILDVSGTVQGALVDSFNAASDALVDFVRTGTADFDGLVNSILDGLAKILVQQLLLAALPGGSAAAGIVSQIFGGGRAGGGPIEAGKGYIVGEEGPELIFAPQGGGNVVPAGETAAMLQGQGQGQGPTVNVAPPQVNIRNVVEGEDAGTREDEILNVISKKRKTVKGLIV